MTGLIHIYTGDGKGKSTAAFGLAVRAAGCGKQVLIVQFFKGRDSGELHIFAQLPNVTVLRLDRDPGFFKYMGEESRAAVRERHDALLAAADRRMRQGQCGLLILDEAISAYNYDALDRGLLTEMLRTKPEEVELVLTGRYAPEELIAAAHYVTEMKKIKHPYDSGITAREGIEF